MSVEVIQRPILPIGDSDCRWNGVATPIVYKFQRKDLEFTSIENDSGIVVLVFDNQDVVSSFNLNDYIYIKSDDGTYDVLTQVDEAALVTGDTKVRTFATFTSVAGAGFVNSQQLKPGYRLELRYYDLSGELITDTVFEHSPSAKGLVIADVSNIKNFLLPDNETDISVEAIEDDANVYKQFYIGYREVWQGSNELEAEDYSSGSLMNNTVIALYGGNQIPNANGGNMAEYSNRDTEIVINDTDFTGLYTNQGGLGDPWIIGTSMSVEVDGTSSQSARRNLIIETGKNYSISVTVELFYGLENADLYLLFGLNQVDILIDAQDATTYNIDVEFTATNNYTYFDVVASATGLEEFQIREISITELSQSNFLTKLDTPVMWRGWPFALSCIVGDQIIDDVYFEAESDSVAASEVAGFTGDLSGKVVSVVMTGSDYDNDVDNEFTIQLKNGTTNDAISELKTIELRDPCQNPIMLEARNTLGGALMWLFEYDQEYTFDYGNGRKAKRLVLKQVGLSINEWESLQDFIGLGDVYKNNIQEFTSQTIKTSSRIGSQVYVVDQQGNRTGVIALPTRNTTNTRLKQHYFELEIEYPEVLVP